MVWVSGPALNPFIVRNITMKLTSRNPGMQNIEQLWESMSTLTSQIVYDNSLCKQEDTKYPVGIRSTQLTVMRALLDELEKVHTKPEARVVLAYRNPVVDHIASFSVKMSDGELISDLLEHDTREATYRALDLRHLTLDDIFDLKVRRTLVPS